MSADNHAHAHAHAHKHAHGHAHPADGHGDAPGHGTLGSYLIGFGLSVVLTAVPFWLVMTGWLGSPQATAMTVMAFALVQVVVHMIYFLHLSSRSENGWNMMALIFTLVLVAITLVGSLWVMHHMNANMMPGMGSGDTGTL